MGLGANCADGDDEEEGALALVRAHGKRKLGAEREEGGGEVVDLDDDDGAGGKGARSHFGGHTPAGTQQPHPHAAAALVVDLDGQSERNESESARPGKRPRAHDNGDGDFVVCRAGSNYATVGAVARVVSPKRWVNDLVINTYLALLARNPSPQKIKIMSSHFFSRLAPEKDRTLSGEIHFDLVKHWIEDNLLEFDSVMFPICLNKHWILGVVNFQRKRVEVYDSMRRCEGSDKVAEHIRKALCKLIAEIAGHPLPEGVVELCNNLERPRIPQQDNDNDCGVFVLEVARHLYSGANFENQDDASVRRLRVLMGLARKRIAAQLLGGGVPLL